MQMFQSDERVNLACLPDSTQTLVDQCTFLCDNTIDVCYYSKCVYIYIYIINPNILSIVHKVSSLVYQFLTKVPHLSSPDNHGTS